MMMWRHLVCDANITDTNAYEALYQTNPPSSETEPLNDGEPLLVPPPENTFDISIQPETRNSETALTLTVELFPYGQPSAPITDTPQGTTIYESTQDTLEELVWAPF
jgi:hypothetical protein